MKEQCKCGAEDCPNCNPSCRQNPERERIATDECQVVERKFSRGRWWYPEDFVCEGYRESPY